jgi:serine/threonine protein kinase/tetratricopeptide (TPR) repeat protein
MTETVFKRLGPFEIIEEIGRGGMAVVFLAMDTRSQQRVALRLVPTREPADVLDAERWGAELQAEFCRVSGSVPRLYEHGIAGGYFYVAMEYLDGENLSDLIRRGPIEPARAASIAVGLCRFLEDAQGFDTSVGGRAVRQLLHGDLTPRNVRLPSDGRVRVLDFGIAKALSLSRRVTRNDFGSIAYLSPERLETGGEMDATDGFWSIGVMLYEMVGGQPPFRSADTRRLEQRITSRRPPERLDNPYPAALQAVIFKLLAPTPAERYQSARAIREDLERYAAGVPTLAAGEGWPGRAADEPATRRTRPANGAGADAPDPLGTPTSLSPPIPNDTDETTRRTAPHVVPPPLPSTTVVPPFAAAAGASSPGTAAPAPSAVTGGEFAGPVVAGAGAASVRAGTASGAAASGRVARRNRVALALGLVLAALVASLVVNEILVARSASRLSRTVPALAIADVPDMWNQYEALAQRSVLRVGAASLRRSLTRQTQDVADRVFGNYRTGVSSIRERQWLQTRDVLTRAAIAVPDDERIRASLRFVEGHLHRINGDARRERNQAVPARQEYAEAVTAFREAAQLRPKWPDPFLGLSRTFIYGLGDVERGADALSQAERMGYASGERERAQLADGYRDRGDILSRTARDLQGMPQERESLDRAVEAYQKALELYTKAAGVSDVARSMRAAQRGLDEARKRLDALANPSPPEEHGLNFLERILR